jgi:WD repeat-containing protein 45
MEDEEEKKEGPEIINITFNKFASHFMISMQTGFKIYSTNPLKNTISKDMGGGIGNVDMLDRTNILSLVGGGDNPKYPVDKVQLFDDI